MLRSIRRAAKTSLALPRISVASRISSGWLTAITVSRFFISDWSAAVSSADKRSPSAVIAARRPSSRASASTRASPSWRANMSSLACSYPAFSMSVICASPNPKAGFTTISLRAPVCCSTAETARMPSASTWNVTSMRAEPATIGGIPVNSKQARERQSSTRSRSPCTTCTTSPVCPSRAVVNSCARATGIVLLRLTMRSTSPP